MDIVRLLSFPYLIIRPTFGVPISTAGVLLASFILPSCSLAIHILFDELIELPQPGSSFQLIFELQALYFGVTRTFFILTILARISYFMHFQRPRE